MIKGLFKSTVIAATLIMASAVSSFAQTKKGTSIPIAISVEGSGPGFATFNRSLFEVEFVESLEKKIINNLHVAGEGEKPAVQLTLTLTDFQLLGPNEQNGFKNVTRKVQVGIDKEGKPIYENRTIQENVVTYQLAASAKVGIALNSGEVTSQILGPGIHRRYQKKSTGAPFPSPESVTAEKVVLTLFKANDWLILRNALNRSLKNSDVVAQNQ